MTRDAPRVTRTVRLAVVLALNAALVVAQVAFGIAAHSLGLLSDGGHNMADVAAIALSLLAERWALRPPTASRSFGYHRATILSAMTSAGLLIAMSVVIAIESARRLAHPQSVRGGIVLGVAAMAAVIDLAAAQVARDRTRNLNMRATVIHMAGDAVSAGAVAVAGLVILVTNGTMWLDPAASVVVAVAVAYEAWRIVASGTAILLEAAPRDVDLDALGNAMRAFPGVTGVHDLHVWSLSSELHALSAHVSVAGDPKLAEARALGDELRRAVAEQFGIDHATLELECDAEDEDHDGTCRLDPIAHSPHRPT
ncbi:MAG: cation diffusion facilitator family transporter [Actinomycetota bacterium]|nr:cation diffusion facilitator family transporter [Actinomycetota bacterium]